MTSEGFLFLPFVARSRHSRLRAAFADTLQTRLVIVVGYYNVDVKAGKFSMIAINIDPMNPEKTATLDELFPYNANMAASTGSSASDRIQVWDYVNQSYRYFFIYNNPFSTADVKNKHWVENLTDKPFANVPIKTGDAVFYYALKKDNSFSIPGQVPNEAVGTLKQGYNMIGVGFPAEWCPNDAGTDFWKNAAFAGATGSSSADRIQYWDEANDTYKHYFLYKNPFNAGDVKNNKWVDTTSKDELTEPLKTGSGFFYWKKNAGEIEFKPGLKL